MADFGDFAVGANEAKPQQVVSGQPVFQAAHAAGIFRHIASDRAGGLRRRIGRVKQIKRRRRLADREVARAGLDPRGRGDGIDSQDAIHFRGREQNAFFVRQGAARQAGARPARDKRRARFGANLNRRGDLRFGFRQQNKQRPLAIQRKRIGFERARLFRIVENGARRQSGAKTAREILRGPRHR